MRKATGIVRRIDNLGRIVVPKELRTTMEIDVKDPIEIYVSDDGAIVLSKYQPSCVFCDSKEDVFEYRGKYICKECSKKLEEIK